MTPLMMACRHKVPLDTVKFLIDNGADINGKDNVSHTYYYKI